MEEPMIKTQELQMQIEELTKQNDMMLAELEQMKQLMTAVSSGQNQSQNQGQNQNQNFSSSSGGKQRQGNQQQQTQDQIANLANDLQQIKSMVTKLEEKTSQFVSSQTNGSMTQKDVVNLVLTLINGMIDWASDFVSGQALASGQQQ
jgi:predicted RNase H-like nuclease (RuvC/YqgF family)